MFSMAHLTRQLARITVSPLPRAAIIKSAVAAPTRAALGPQLLAGFDYLTIQNRGFARGSRKDIDEKNAKRLRIQNKKKKNTPKPASKLDGDEVKSVSVQPLLQHQEWVKFQQSIAVEGFETGQVTTAKVVKKSKGGKQIRRKKEKELAELQAKRAERGGLGKFPAIRYSEEETQRLLAEAMSMLPKRDGKRGTLNLRRQKRRWFLVRKIRAKYKRLRIAEHENKMERRSRKVEAVKTLKAEVPDVRRRDLDYQAQVLRRWAQNMVQDTGASEVDGIKMRSED